MVNFFFSIFPLNEWRDLLIRIHIQKCPPCQKRIASLEEAKHILIQEGEVGDMDGLWLTVKPRLSAPERKERHLFWPRWRWAAGAAAVVVAIVVGFWFYSATLHDRGAAEENMIEKFQINYIKIDQKPARAYVFWPQESDMILIWAEKNI